MLGPGTEEAAEKQAPGQHRDVMDNWQLRMPGLYLNQQKFVEDKRDEQRVQKMIETDVSV